MTHENDAAVPLTKREEKKKEKKIVLLNTDVLQKASNPALQLKCSSFHW